MEAPSAQRSWHPAQMPYLIGLILMIGLFLGFTIRDGHRAGDFAMFMQHTINVVHGQPYAESAYAPNPHALTAGGPNVFPPGWPMTMVPVYFVFGLNLTALKWCVILFFLGVLFLMAHLARQDLDPVYVLGLVTVIGLQPYFWDIKENVLSDIPFLFWVCLTLILVQRLSSRVDSASVVSYVLIGLTMYVATATRTVGITLPAGLLLYDLVRTRRVLLSRLFWIPTGVFVICTLLQNLLFPIESNETYTAAFLQQLGSPFELIDVVIENAKYYILACLINIIFENGHVSVLKFLIAGLTFLLTAMGLYRHFRTRFSILDAFLIAYVGLLLLWPYRMPSYFIPIYAFLFYYAAIGLKFSVGFLPSGLRTWVWGLYLILILGTYAGRYTTLDFERLDQDIASPAAMALYEYIESHTDAQSMLVCRVPTAPVLFTGRPTTPPLVPEDDRDRFNAEEAQANFDYFDDVDARYIITGPKGELFHREVLPLWYLVQDYPDRFEQLFKNEEFVMYAYLPDTIPVTEPQ
jgi:hypothetical protein